MDSHNSVVEIRSAHVNLLRDFNLAGVRGGQNWGEFVRMAQRSGFTDDDFRCYLNVSSDIVRQWARSAGHPPEAKREDYRRIIHDRLKDKLNGNRSNVFPLRR